MFSLTDIEKDLTKAFGAVESVWSPETEVKLKAGKVLRVKLGLDPTAADIHLGHTVVINVLRKFQDLGHHIMLLIGDFTARIGDPTGKNVMRKQLSPEQITENAKTYTDQIFKILDPEKTEVVYNSHWLDAKKPGFMLELASMLTVARMLERDDFKKRYESGQAIGIHEFMYPLLQGYDSVELKADIEVGGTDQKFNLLMGRELQTKFGQHPPQSILMMPLLIGLDGEKKMSKSLGNYIGVTDAPNDMFGKVMSVHDDLLWHYFELLSFEPIQQIEVYKKEVAAGANPRDYKVRLGQELVARFHDAASAMGAYEDFVNRFSNNAVPQDLPDTIIEVTEGELGIAAILKISGLTTSTSEAIRMVKQGAVRIDGEKVEDHTLKINTNQVHIYQVGKRKAAKIVFKK